MAKGEPEQDDRTPADERVGADLLALLQEQLALDENAVRVLLDEEQGVFRLEGVVPDCATRERAGELARDFGRMKRVDNRLRVATRSPAGGAGR